jgi:rSAM/selenodomain-associated transferase 1
MIPSHSSTTALIIFAKAPVAGMAKTRLIPALGAQGAATLATRLLEHSVAMGLAAGFDHLELCTTPDIHDGVFQSLAARHALALTTQQGNDLGERMDRALKRVLNTHSRVLLAGTDAPSLDTAVLRAAAAALDRFEAVFVPALDGGYVLVGLTRPASSLFSDMIWSNPQVMAATRARATAAQLRWTELAPVADIDEPADLVHLPSGWLP